MMEAVMESILLDLNSCYIVVGGNKNTQIGGELEHRAGRISPSITETRAIIEDCRVNTVGGLVAGLDIWELAIIPSLLNNSQTWVNIEQSSIDMLEDLHNMMYRKLLGLPKLCQNPPCVGTWLACR